VLGTDLPRSALDQLIQEGAFPANSSFDLVVRADGGQPVRLAWQLGGGELAATFT
jgi:hypothetical protein